MQSGKTWKVGRHAAVAADPQEYDLENVCWRSKKNQTLFYVSLIDVTKGLAYESEYFEQLVKNV